MEKGGRIPDGILKRAMKGLDFKNPFIGVISEKTPKSANALGRGNARPQHWRQVFPEPVDDASDVMKTEAQ